MEDWESAPLLEQPKKEAWESAPVLVDTGAKPGRGNFLDTLDFISSLSQPIQALKLATDVTNKVRSAIGWERPDPRPQQRVGSGVIDALRAGYQGSATGLAVRESLPDIVLDASHSKWYEELASSVGHVVSEAPWNVAGFALAGSAGLPTGPGALALGGAGAMALPAAVRESLTQSYMKGEVASVSDFLERTAIVLNVAGKEGAVGALAGPAGAQAKVAAAPLGKVASTIVGGAAEVGTMVVTPAMIEGRLPERKEFTHAAVLLFGLKGAHAGTNLLFKTFEKTGKPPIQVLEEANADPALKAELMQQLEVFQREAETLPLEKYSVRERVRSEIDSAVGNRKVFIDDLLAETNVINGDSIAERFPSVAENKVSGHRFAAEHGGVNLIAADAFARKLAEPVANDKPVILLVGNAAVGKSTIAEKYKGSAHVVLDTNAANSQGLIDNANAAIRSGRRVDIVHVHAPLKEAVRRNVDRQSKDGRPVSIKDQADMDISTLHSFATAHDILGADPKARFINLELTPEGKLRGALEGDLARAEIESLREANRQVSTLTVATDAYTEILKEGKHAPDREARAEFERGIEDRLQPSERTGGAGAPGVAGEAQPEAIGPRVQVEPDLPPAYRQQAAEMAAAEAFPGTKDQIQEIVDHPFADIPDTKIPFDLNFRTIDGPDALRALQAKMSLTLREEMVKAGGGRQTWAEIQAKADKQVIAMGGRDFEKVLAGREIGDVDNAVQSAIRRDIMMKAAYDAATAIDTLSKAGVDATGAMKADVLEKTQFAAMVQADFAGNGSELARALGFYRATKQLRQQGAEYGKIFQLYGKNTDKVIEQLKLMRTPEAISKASRMLNKATTEQKLLEIWRAFMISGPDTHAANIAGGLLQLSRAPFVEVMAAGYGTMPWVKDGVHISEPIYRVIGQKLASLDAIKAGGMVLKTAAKDIWAVPDPEAKKARATDDVSYRQPEAVGGRTGEIVRVPFKFLEAADVPMRIMAEQGEAYAMAARQAHSEGLNLSTREFTERVMDLGSNPPDAWIDQIQAAGDRATFTSPLGEIGRDANKLVVKAHAQWVFPWRTTPANIAKEVIRMTPAAPVIGEWRAAFGKGGAEMHKAVAEVVFGTAVMSTVMGLAFNGLVSGNGDPDPAKRRIQESAGWQPYSIKVDGEWHNYQRMQPIGTLIGLAADLSDTWKYMTADESDKAVKLLGVAFANAITKQTTLAGASTLVEAITAPERKMAKLAQNFISSWVPSAIGQTARYMDDYVREVNSIREAVTNRIPWLREELPPTRDPFGEPKKNPDRIGPVTITEESEDKVRTEAARLRIGQGEAPKAITLPHGGLGGDIGKVELTPEQRDIFGEVAGKEAYKALSEIVNSPSWDFIPDAQQAKIYKAVFERTNQLGKAKALTPEEWRAAIQKTLKDVQEELKKKRTSS